MPSQTFEIGQVIYVLSNKKQTVIPAVIAEEDCRKVRKQDGVHEVVNYKVCIGPKGRQATVDLSRIDGEVFTSLDDMRTAMTNRLTEFIDGLVKRAQIDIHDWYGITVDNQVLNSDPVENQSKIDPEQLMQAVNNGTPLMPSQSAQQGLHPLQLNGYHQSSPHNSVRENIRSMVDPGMDIMDPNGPSQVILPNGKVVKVNGLD